VKFTNTHLLSRSFLPSMRNFSDKSCTENQNTHFVNNNFFFKSCPLWHNVEKYYRVRDLRPRWSTRRKAGFSCAILYKDYLVIRSTKGSPARTQGLLEVEP